jgi:DNA topoisomerase-6 subunit B
MGESIAEQMAEKRKAISVSEFFERNKQILGFDSPTKALLTCVKEAVDNCLDACEEARILPNVGVQIEQLDKDGGVYRVIVDDNGPGIVKKQIGSVFAKLLYGSRFHQVKMARGQQGIGISACVLYAQITTGRPSKVISKVQEKDTAVVMELMIDVRKNEPSIVKEDVLIWDRPSGTRVELQVKGRYVKAKASVYEYLKQTALVNPHARVTLVEPDGTRTVFERADETLPAPTREVKPHPYGTELGTLLRMAKETKSYKLSTFLTEEFSRVSPRVAEEICQAAGMDPELRLKELDVESAQKLVEAFGKVKIMAPESDCLSPIGPTLIKKGLKNVLGAVRPEIYLPPLTRDPRVYGGNPFVVEIGMVYGGDLPADQPVSVLRFGNRVPLLYEPGSCAITKAVENVDWRRYGLEQRGGQGPPVGPLVIMVHVGSTKVPFTSEAKVAVASVPEIQEEIELALKACARRLKSHLNKKAQRAQSREKFTIVNEVLPQIAQMSAKVLEKPVPDISRSLTKIMNVIWIDDRVEWRTPPKPEPAKGRKKAEAPAAPAPPPGQTTLAGVPPGTPGWHQIAVDVYNYTPRTRKMKLHLEVPPEAKLQFGGEEPDTVESGRLTWSLTVESVKKVEISLTLRGINREDYGENEVFVSDIDPGIVIGAEPLPGDWGVEKLVEETEAGAPAEAEDEEGEVDVDSVSTVEEDD